MKNKAEEIYNKRISEYLESHPMERFDDIPDVVFISAMQEYADLCKQDEGWVSVDYSFPHHQEEVLLFMDHGDRQEFLVDRWSKELEKYHKMNHITHWQPLPKKPST